MKQFIFSLARVLSEYFKIQNIILTSIKLEVQILKNHRQVYNPNRYVPKIEKAYKNNNLITLVSTISLYSSHFFLFYFWPLWILSFPFYLFINLKVWKSTWLKISFSIYEYKGWTKKSLISNFKGTFDLKIMISFFPFIFGISYIIYSRYQNQVFPYFIHKNLPGVYPSFARLKWDTFQNIISPQLAIKPIGLMKPLPNKNILLSNKLNVVSNLKEKAGTIIDVSPQSENKNEFINLSNPSHYKNMSVQTSSPYSQITSGFKLNKFIKQLDFYSDSFLIKLNSAWVNKKQQVYVGFFKKSTSLESSLISTNFLLNKSTNFQIGNNWYLVSPKQHITFSNVISTKFFSQKSSFVDLSQFITNTRHSSKKVELKLNSRIKNYWETFYLNLDELPKKLNSKNTLSSSDNLSNLNTKDLSHFLPLKNYLDDYKNFVLNSDIKQPHQLETTHFLTYKMSEQPLVVKKTNAFNQDAGVNLLGFKTNLFNTLDGSTNSIQAVDPLITIFGGNPNTYVSKKIKFRYKKINTLLEFPLYSSFEKIKLCLPANSNLVQKAQVITPSVGLHQIDSKVNLNLKKMLSIQTIEGFSSNSLVGEFKEVSLDSASLLHNKFNLLQNELRHYFFNKGLNPLLNLQRGVPNLNTYKCFLNLLLDKKFFSNDNRILEYINNDPKVKNYSLNINSKLASTVISPEKSTFTLIKSPTLEESGNQTTVDYLGVVTNPQEATHLKNKILLADPTLNDSYILTKCQDYCSEQILQILQKMGPLKINLTIEPRMMSGYEFPDISNLELQSLILQDFYQKKVSINTSLFRKNAIQTQVKLFSPILKVEFPPSFTSHLNYNYYNSKTPNFKLNYRPTFLQGLKKILYEGPGVLRDNLTQDLNLTNKQEIQQWIKQFLSPDNPLTDRREVFFGHNLAKLALSNNELTHNNNDKEKIVPNNENFSLSENVVKLSANDNLIQTSSRNNLTPPDSLIKSSASRKTEIEIQKVKKQIGQALISKTGETQSITSTKLNASTLPVLSFIEEFQVPYLNKSQWQTILEKLKASLEKQLEDKSELDEKFQVDVPLVRIRNPKQQTIQWPLNQLDYQNLDDFIFNSKTNLFRKSTTFRPLPFINKTNFDNLADFYFWQGQKSDSPTMFQDIAYRHPNGAILGNNSRLFQQWIVKEKNSTTINYHYLPSAQILLNDNLSQKKIFGNIYKKVFTGYKNLLENPYESFNQNKRKTNANNIFVKSFSTVFYQSWEPITIGSWMMITQLSFGLVVLQILQESYRKYGKELISYLLDLIASLGIIDETLKNELKLDDDRKGFRLIKKVPKRFRDIAGIDSILPELGEIVWFLRNSGRSFKVGNIIPKGILLIGSPGTGKTLLVQAIAGEAEVPVLVQSGSSLNDPEQEGVGEQNLKNLFEQARQMAPCIVFIDEIDALGEKRENIIQNPMGTDEIIESIQEQMEFKNLGSNQFIPKPKINFSKRQTNDLDKQDLLRFSAQDEGALINQNLESFENSNFDIMQQSIDKQEAKQEQLSLLMQFLIEMDGLRSRKGVIVIGATNRPEVLDLALTRPGRFDQTLQLGLPDKQKRIDILKLYSKNLGALKNISWDYLANRTIGFSAADLAAVMNESSMKAILTETIHTIETIEKGIESITSYSSPKIERKSQNYVDPFIMSRLAYYQAGKAVVHTLLLQHPSITVLHLWPKKKNARHTYINSIIQKSFLKNSRKLELESRLVGLYAGKAAELLILSNNVNTSNKSSFISSKPQKSLFETKELYQSDIGIGDLNFATYLVESMISNWYFYSKNLLVRKSNQIIHQRNLQEIQELDTLDFFNKLAIDTEIEIIRKTRSSGLKRDFQKWSIRPWWQTQITQQIGVLDPAYDDWYRIYLPDPEESERNEEWIPPDEYYHNNNQLSDLALKSSNSSINWNDLYINDRDYISHGLLLTCFNTAFTILDRNRELLDYLASYLLQNEVLREHEINDILFQFRTKVGGQINTNLSTITQNLEYNDSYSISKQILEEKLPLQKSSRYREQNDAGLTLKKVTKSTNQQKFLVEKNKKAKIIENSWGKDSRRQMFRFLKF